MHGGHADMHANPVSPQHLHSENSLHVARSLIYRKSFYYQVCCSPLFRLSAVAFLCTVACLTNLLMLREA